MPNLLVSTHDGTLLTSLDLEGRRCVTIGRSPRCDLTLEAPSISRRHALLLEHDGRWHLTDTGSRNGIGRSHGGENATLLIQSGWARVGPAFLWIDRHEAPAGVSTHMGLAPVEEGHDAPALVVLEHDAATLKRLDLTGLDLVTIGRDPVCDVPLDDPEVALLHCALYTEHRGWYVTNLASPGGTWVEGGPTRRRRLLDERIIRIGGTRLWLDAASHCIAALGSGGGNATIAGALPADVPHPCAAAPSRPRRAAGGPETLVEPGRQAG